MANNSPPADLHSAIQPSTAPRRLLNNPFPLDKVALLAYIDDKLGHQHKEKEAIEVLDLQKGGKAMAIATKEDSGDDDGDATGHEMLYVATVKKNVKSTTLRIHTITRQQNAVSGKAVQLENLDLAVSEIVTDILSSCIHSRSGVIKAPGYDRSEWTLSQGKRTTRLYPPHIALHFPFSLPVSHSNSYYLRYRSKGTLFSTMKRRNR